MKDIILASLNFVILFLRLLLPGGVRKVAAENLVLRKQLINMSRGMKRSPKLTTSDRVKQKQQRLFLVSFFDKGQHAWLENLKKRPRDRRTANNC